MQPLRNYLTINEQRILQTPLSRHHTITAQQQRVELLTVTDTWQAKKYKVHKFHHNYKHPQKKKKMSPPLIQWPLYPPFQAL